MGTFSQSCSFYDYANELIWSNDQKSKFEISHVCGWPRSDDTTTP